VDVYDNSTSFKLLTSEREFQFLVENQTEKLFWMKKIEDAILSYFLYNNKGKSNILSMGD
jgi:hypothetical protein